ncbi:ABC1 kinase family protein [Virgibacillus senegalensis]|uniref:ABC1 kinase family protein n=1 Tax=Virgibacillus senegalensis TaxID=1499679 RepID=UPI00069E7713|nr:AarF/UbiB family protein [Virgibacillus senegalensis]
MKYNTFYRIFSIVFMTIKFLLQIYSFHFIHRVWDRETSKKWERLLAGQAREYRKKALELGGLLIKFGQFLSTRADLLPAAFIKELQGLTDQVKSVPFRYSREIMEEEWQTDLEDHLADIDRQPIASASIGEVYKARLHDGTTVAVKVRRHRVEEVFHKDFRALRIVFWLLSRFTVYGEKADLQKLYKEIVSVMSQELDFEQELKYANYFKSRYKDNEYIHIPEYFDELCTARVLVMEWAEGVKIDNLSFMQENGIERKQVAKRLFDFYVDQFINPGFFHADPHVGNILIRRDGTLVILDYGMAGEIRKEDTKQLRNIVQGVILDDYDRVIRALLEMDFLLENYDTEKIKKLLKKTMDLYQEEAGQRMQSELMEQVMEDLQVFVKEQPIQLPADYAFLGRAASILLGVLLSIYPEMDVVKWARPVVKQWASGENGKGSIYTEVLKESTRPLLSLPRELIDWMNDGERDREWEKNKQRYKFMHQYYLFYAIICFFLLTVGAAVLTAGWFLDSQLLLKSGAFSGGLFLILLAALARKHYKMIHSLKHKRRFW